MTSHNHGVGVDRRYQTLPLSAGVSSARRARGTVPSNSTPTCEESIHYPVFNPRDPRHNPTAHTSSWLEDNYYPSETSKLPGSMNWMQSLSKRSLRKARPVPKSLLSSTSAEASPLQERTEGSSNLPTSVLTETVPNTLPPVLSDENSIEPESSPSSKHENRSGCNSITSKLQTSDNIEPKSSLTSSSSSESGIPPTTAAASTSSGCVSSPVDESKSAEVEETGDQLLVADSSPSSDYPSGHENPESHAPVEEGTAVRHSRESDASEVKDIDLMMDSLGALDHLNSQSGQTPCRDEQVDEHDINRPTASPGHASTESGTPADVSNVERESSHINLGRQSDSIRLQVQTGRWNRHLPARLGGTNLVDPPDFFRDQAAWSNRPSEDCTTTDITSESNILWTPVDNAELTSLASLGDEYFLVDGKTDGFYPDRGDNPTKAERRLVGDSSMGSGYGLDRNSSAQTQDIPETFEPVEPVHLRLRPCPRDRDTSDSADDYQVTYPLFMRYYLS
ncbi:hypothetical protein EYZ11_003285 [Aspergillus tanneri]|uniref:Uncharacterized protein n=1 Tax=Aspergillus tanneri TaxID=1220188 RepID=A0A4S3JNR2_9EURO|nr:hypothetical protein EYZ11_003285 [Aspergillus tanneri]